MSIIWEVAGGRHYANRPQVVFDATARHNTMCDELNVSILVLGRSGYHWG